MLLFSVFNIHKGKMKLIYFCELHMDVKHIKVQSYLTYLKQCAGLVSALAHLVSNLTKFHVNLWKRSKTIKQLRFTNSKCLRITTQIDRRIYTDWIYLVILVIFIWFLTMSKNKVHWFLIEYIGEILQSTERVHSCARGLFLGTVT